MISQCPDFYLTISKPEVESLSIFWFNTVLINILFYFKVIKHRVKKCKSKRTNTKKVINKSCTNSSACYKGSKYGHILMFTSARRSRKSKMQSSIWCIALFKTTLCSFKHECIAYYLHIHKTKPGTSCLKNVPLHLWLYQMLVICSSK